MAGISNILGKGSTSLTDRVFDLMRDQIIAFELMPFHALSDKKIAEKIGISRTPVREALARLAAQNLVDIYPQRGTVVSPLRRSDLERSQFIREALEVGVVLRVAALENRRELVTKLRAEIALQQTFVDIGDEERFYSSDEDFHRLLATYASLPGLWEEIQRSKIHMDRCRHLTLTIFEKDLSIIVAQHNAIIDAIEAGDSDAAVKAIRNHLRRVFWFVDQLIEIHPEYFEGSRQASPAMEISSAVSG